MVEKGKVLFERLLELATEARNPRTMDLDSLEPQALLQRINDEDARVPAAVRAVIPEIARAVDLIHSRLRAGGRLIYVGAGTSGRLGILDAAECPPTFGTDPAMIQGVVAGGHGALVRAVEGAEDDADAGVKSMDDLGVGAADVVTGLAASWRTPFTVAAVRRAAERGSATIYVTTNPPECVELAVDVLIAPEVGPEAVMGSTRMKSAVAQKMVLTMLTTCVMVRMGKVYENMMVDLGATSQKLHERSKRVLMTITGLGYTDAERRLEEAGGSVKRAVVMTLGQASPVEADEALAAGQGRVRAALEYMEGRRRPGRHERAPRAGKPGRGG